jgi:hypothetical protein
VFRPPCRPWAKEQENNNNSNNNNNNNSTQNWLRKRAATLPARLFTSQPEKCLSASADDITTQRAAELNACRKICKSSVWYAKKQMSAIREPAAGAQEAENVAYSAAIGKT